MPTEGPVAVVGGGLGGLSAALWLRKFGVEVDLFEAGDRVGGRANRLDLGPYRFDTGPSLLNYPWVFERLFTETSATSATSASSESPETGSRLEDFVELLPVEPALTFAWRDGQRFALSSDFERLGAECERFAPDARTGLAAFFHDAAIKYRLAFDKLINRNEDNPLRWLTALSPSELGRLSLWRSLDKELGRFFDHPRLVEALGCYSMYLGGSPFELPGFYSILPYGELAYGLWLPKGGMYGLIEAVAELARQRGIRIETGRRVEEIETRDGAVVGLRFADGERRAFSRVISNVDVPTTETRLLTSTPGQARREKAAHSTRMTLGVITFYWGIRGTVDQLPHHTVFLPDDYRTAFEDLFDRSTVPDDLPFYISVASATDPDLAPEGGSTLFVLVPAPLVSQWSGDPDELVARARRQVIERLRHHGMEIEDLIEVEEVWDPREWRDRFGLYDGSAFGAAHNFTQIGPFRRRNFARRPAGLYFAGAGTTPGTGLPMVTLSGELAARRLLEHAEKGRP